MQNYQIILWIFFVILTVSKALLKKLHASKNQIIPIHRADFNRQTKEFSKFYYYRYRVI